MILNHQGHPCTFEEYQNKAIPLTSQRFPRPREHYIDPIVLEKLQENETEIIEKEIKNENLIPVKIPKTLYDLFYWRFHMEDRLTAVAKKEALNKIQTIAQNKIEKAKTTNDLYSYLKPKRYVYLPLAGELKIACHAPKIDFKLEHGKQPYGQVIENLYMKQEGEEKYQKVSWHLNERIIAYLKAQSIDPIHLDWENMRKITLSLLDEIDQRYDHSVLLNRKEETFGKIADFSRVYYKNKDRIKSFILGAVWHEYQAPPNVYTIYRGAVVNKDDLESSEPFSFSFGHSPFGGIQYDGASGSPISYAQKDLFAVDINIGDYEKGLESSRMVFIPPARGINRIVECGEVGHVRSKVKRMKDSPLRGFTVGGFLGVPAKDLEFLNIPAETEKEVKQHIKVSRAFFRNLRTVILQQEL